MPTLILLRNYFLVHQALVSLKDLISHLLVNISYSVHLTVKQSFLINPESFLVVEFLFIVPSVQNPVWKLLFYRRSKRLVGDLQQLTGWTSADWRVVCWQVKRHAEFMELKKQITLHMEELDRVPESSFEKDVVCEDEDSFCLSRDNISALKLLLCQARCFCITCLLSGSAWAVKKSQTELSMNDEVLEDAAHLCERFS